MKTIRQLFILVLAIAISGTAYATLPPPAQSPAQSIDAANVIVVGRITQAEVVADSSGQPIQTAVVQVDRVLKGQPALKGGKLDFYYPLTNASLPVHSDQFGIALLRSAGNGALSPVDASTAFLPALPTPPPINAINPLQALTAELANVLTRPPSDLLRAVGTGWQHKSYAPAQQAQYLYASASSMLDRLPPAVTVPILKQLAATTSSPAARLALVSTLVEAGDESLLDSAAPLVVNPPEDLQPAVVWLSSAIGNYAKTPAALGCASALAQSPILEAQEGAFSALRHIGTTGAVKPLTLGLESNNRMVRYYAVTGLAQITGQRPAPSLPDFEQNEAGYVQFWRQKAAEGSLKAQ